MLKESSTVMGIFVIVICVVAVIGTFYKEGYTQDSNTMGITETVRSAAIENTDYSSRLESGQFFIMKDEFEEDFVSRISKNKNVKISDQTDYSFDYLDNQNGSTKAIKVLVSDGDQTYQATYVINIADTK